MTQYNVIAKSYQSTVCAEYGSTDVYQSEAALENDFNL